MGNGAWSLAVLLVWCCLFPTRTAECIFTFITVEAVRAIVLAFIAKAMTFFLDHRGPDGLLRSGKTERITSEFSGLFSRCMEIIVTSAFEVCRCIRSIAHEVAGLAVSLLLCSDLLRESDRCRRDQ